MTQPTSPPEQSQRPEAPPGLTHANEHNHIPTSLPANDLKPLIDAMASHFPPDALSHLEEVKAALPEQANQHALSWLTVNHG